MSRAALRRCRWFLLASILLALLILVAARVAARYRPPAGRPIADTGSAPVSLLTAPPTVADLRSSLQSANLLIVVLDAARADHAGCYGYPRETTPNIDAIAAESLVFEQHFSQFPHTRSSTVSLFTGQYPDTHGVYGHGGTPPEGPSLAQALRATGFETAFFSGWLVASPVMGIGGEFEFVSAPTRGRGGRRSRAVSRRNPGDVASNVSDWLHRRPPGRFLAYLHLLQPHPPYEPPEEFVELFRSKPPHLWRGRLPSREIKHTSRREMSLRQIVNLYDANYRYADEAVGELVRLLEQEDSLDNTLLIITSDHGEAFGEHGYEGHREGVYDEHLHVPLLMRFPGDGAPVGRVRALTETVDIFPTVLHLLGLDTPETVQGKSLVPLITGATPRVRDFVFARAEGKPESYLIRDENWALILFRGGELRALYDLAEDPWQTRNVIARESDVAERMMAAFRQFAGTQRYPPLDFVDANWKSGLEPLAAQRHEFDITDEARRELEALGYLQ
jgi:arylsulfatase A-like enzyme